MEIRKVHIALADYTDPTLQNVGGGLLGTGWIRGTQSVGAEGVDGESGVSAVAVSANGQQIADQPGSCETIGSFAVRFDPCTSPLTDNGQGVTTEAPFRDGDNAVRVCASDFAGNTDCQGFTVKVDNTPPSVAFASTQDRRDPERIVAAASDATSGVAGGTISFRPQGSGASWQPLSTELSGSDLVARVDSEKPPPGAYEFMVTTRRRGRQRGFLERARGRDADGAQLSAQGGDEDQGAPEPGRVAPHRPRLCGRRRRLRATHARRWGRPQAATGEDRRELRAGGDRRPPALHGAHEAERPLPSQAPARPLARHRGRLRAQPPLPGCGSRRPGASWSEAGRASRPRRSESGPESGSTSTARSTTTEPGSRSAGKLVELQVKQGARQWNTVQQAIHTNSTGRYHLHYRFGTFYRSNVRYRFRVKVDHEADWPYKAPVRSRARSVTVIAKHHQLDACRGPGTVVAGAVL